MTNIILQGLPGIGKTTLTKKIANRLKEMAVEVTGFYTEELRDNRNYRVGFDIITLDDRRGILARKSMNESKYKVGSYSVDLEDFEKTVLPLFDNIGSIVIIDEVGKMELFSKKFETKVENLIADQSVKIVATVPLKGGGPLIQKLKNTSNHLITVNAANRDKLLEEIIPIIIK